MSLKRNYKETMAANGNAFITTLKWKVKKTPNPTLFSF